MTDSTFGRSNPRPCMETVGEYWIDLEGVIWMQITYTDKPTAQFRRVDDQTQRMSGVVGSALLTGLRRLVPEDPNDCSRSR